MKWSSKITGRIIVRDNSEKEIISKILFVIESMFKYSGLWSDIVDLLDSENVAILKRYDSNTIN